QLGTAGQSASAGSAAAAPTFDVLNLISSRADGLRLVRKEGSGLAAGDGPLEWASWGQVLGGHATQSARNQMDGYSASYGGLILGTDRAVSDQWRLGGVFTYNNAAVHNDGDTTGDSTRINSYGLVGY